MATSPCKPCVLHPCVCRNTPHSTWQLLAFQTEHLESWGDVLFISVATAHSTVPPESVRNPQQMFVQWLKREGVETSTHLSLHSYPVVLSVLCNPFYLILSRQWHPTSVLLPENPTGRGAWRAAVHGITKSRTRLSDFTFTFSDYLSSILIPRKVLYFHAWIGGTANLPFESVFLIVIIQSSTRNNENSIYILTLF